MVRVRDQKIFPADGRGEAPGDCGQAGGVMWRPPRGVAQNSKCLFPPPYSFLRKFQGKAVTGDPEEPSRGQSFTLTLLHLLQPVAVAVATNVAVSAPW